MEASDAPGCAFCGRAPYDPEKREGHWSRGVKGGRQILVCPSCQAAHPGWRSEVDRCAACGSPRLSRVLGQIACRDCGAVAEAPE